MKKLNLVILTGVSGAGKTDLVKDITTNFSDKSGKFPTSTSRPMRPGEINAKDYFFYEPEVFKKRIAQNKFFEYEEVYPGGFYGCEYHALASFNKDNKLAIAPIDIAGALKFLGIRESTEKSFINLDLINPRVYFINVDRDEAIRRIKRDNELGKRSDKEEEIQKRIKRMDWEFEQIDYFKNVIDNPRNRKLFAYEKLVQEIFKATAP